ncbi:MAG: helix-turn-helix transcriptional regulator, partial [Lachnospiraceae bacterium]|nr:helix-turn-helix transcriptional regulator [Lachnospiraceae bacterium]
MFDLENKSIHVSKIKLSSQSFSKKIFISHNIKLCMVKKGSALWQIEDRLVPVKEGDVVILNNHMKRVFKGVNENTGIELAIVEFEPQLFMNSFRGILYGKNVEAQNVISGHEGINRLFLEIEQEAQKKLSYSEILIGAKLVEVLSLMMRHFDIAEQSNVKMGSDMYRVLEYIDEHYRKDISQQQVADLVNMSTTGFSRYFTKCMGVGFAGYIMQKRIQFAIHLLK